MCYEYLFKDSVLNLCLLSPNISWKNLLHIRLKSMCIMPWAFLISTSWVTLLKTIMLIIYFCLNSFYTFCGTREVYWYVVSRSFYLLMQLNHLLIFLPTIVTLNTGFTFSIYMKPSKFSKSPSTSSLEKQSQICESVSHFPRALVQHSETKLQSLIS